MIRRFLDGLYRVSGYLSAAFLVGIVLAILFQMLSRFRGAAFDSTELAGFCLAASTFFGLAYTLRAGGHVRITLAVDALPPAPRRAVEILNCLIAGTAVTFLAWQVTLLALQSFAFHDVSPGLLGVPFWIPQAGAAAGVTVFAVALLDELVWVLRGETPRYEAAEGSEETHFE